MELDKNAKIGVIGSGTMGMGIAQVAAASGHQVVLVDIEQDALDRASMSLSKILTRLVEKGRLESGVDEEILSRIVFSTELADCATCSLVIEAIVERLEVKQELFSKLEPLCSEGAVFGSNTSSLSIASIGSKLKAPERVLGIHFFNPAPLMPLVEIVPGIFSERKIVADTRSLIDSWGKVTVQAKDTPGFIVNRVARPFYGEALRVFEEGPWEPQDIDWCMRELGGFRMGPFELMDLIGNDVNLAVTETVFREFFFDPRFKPSLTQKRMVEAGRLGKKSGRGYYSYVEGDSIPEPTITLEEGKRIFMRILSMLINEAADAVFMNIASAKDVDLAMTKGVNYPKGLLSWGEEIGLDQILGVLTELFENYGEDRYRPNPLLRRKVREGSSFFSH